MDGFKNTTKMKYMCGGPVRKATGGAIKSVAPKTVAKSVAPKSVSKSVASAKQLPTSDLGSKRFIDKTRPEPIREAPRPTMEPKRLIAQTPPEDKGRELPRPTMEPKRQVMRTPPEDVRTIGGEPKAPKNVARPAWMEFEKTIGGEPKAPKGGMTMGKSPTDGLTKSPMDRAAPTGPLGSVAKNPPKGGAALSKMAQSVAGKGQKEGPMSGTPKGAKTMGSVNPGAKTMFQDKGRQPNTIGGAPKAPKATPPEPIREAPRLTMEPKRQVQPTPPKSAKTMGSVGMAKKGVPVASNKPMIGQYKTGGYVSKSSFKW